MKPSRPSVEPIQPSDCRCYGRGQCAACTLARMEAGERQPDTEIMRSLRAVGIVRDGGRD